MRFVATGKDKHTLKIWISFWDALSADRRNGASDSCTFTDSGWLYSMLQTVGRMIVRSPVMCSVLCGGVVLCGKGLLEVPPDSAGGSAETMLPFGSTLGSFCPGYRQCEASGLLLKVAMWGPRIVWSVKMGLCMRSCIALAKAVLSQGLVSRVRVGTVSSHDFCEILMGLV